MPKTKSQKDGQPTEPRRGGRKPAPEPLGIYTISLPVRVIRIARARKLSKIIRRYIEAQAALAENKNPAIPSAIRRWERGPAREK